MRVTHRQIGIMGTGTRLFICGLVHSSGVIFVGTYGPEPAFIWKYDPRKGRLEKVGAPGEYQLDSMVEAPNGMIYIGTAYNGLVYRLHPETCQISSLGSPDIDSTSWIITMVRTRQDEIYGAKGLGIFRLDWRRDRLEPLGLVPGDHGTLGPAPCMPITRELVEAPDGTLYGVTNRWLFRFHPTMRRIEPIVDMVSLERACYGLLLPVGPMPTDDCPFVVQSRFSEERTANPLYVYHAHSGRVEPLPIAGFAGEIAGKPVWWRNRGGQPLIVMPTWQEQEQRLRVWLLDPLARTVVEQWETEGEVVDLKPVLGDGLYFVSNSPAGLLQGDPDNRQVRVVARNPEPVECRCLAISPHRVLGTDTYDCGNVFTRDLSTDLIGDHGRVWVDDHRCNYGPAAFAGPDSRYFVANHSVMLPALWVTDLQTNRHWRVGESAIQLVAMGDGVVWGTTGPNPDAYKFDPKRCWLPSWQGRGGMLFRYRPGAERVEELPSFPQAGVIAEAPGGEGQVLVTQGRVMSVLDARSAQVTAELPLPAEALAMAHDARRATAYLALQDGSLCAVRRAEAQAGFVLARLAERFGSTERGFLVLGRTGRVVSVAGDGTVSVYDPHTQVLATSRGQPPLPAGPAADPVDDAWYYADTDLVRFELEPGPWTT
jgi:hypothetical protein